GAAAHVILWQPELRDDRQMIRDRQRIVAPDSVHPELNALREEQVVEGSIGPADGWVVRVVGKPAGAVCAARFGAAGHSLVVRVERRNLCLWVVEPLMACEQHRAGLL